MIPSKKPLRYHLNLGLMIKIANARIEFQVDIGTVAKINSPTKTLAKI